MSRSTRVDFTLVNGDRTAQPGVSKRSWLTDSGWLLGANLARNLGLIVVTILLARYTAPEVVGQYALALAISTPIFVFAQLGLKGVYLTHSSHIAFRVYFKVQIFAALLALVLVCVVGFIFVPKLVLVIVLVGLVKMVDTLADLFTGPLQSYNSTQVIFLGVSASAIVSSLAAGLTLHFSRSLELTLFALALATALTSVVGVCFPALGVIRREENSHSTSSRSDVVEVLRAGVPAGLGGSVLALTASAPQYFLAAFWGGTEVAHYAIFFYIIMIADIFVSTVSQGWIRKARDENVNRSGSSQGFLRYTLTVSGVWSAVLVPVGLIGLGTSFVLIPTVFGAEYTLRLNVLIPIFAAIIVMPLLNFSNIAVIVRNLYRHTLTLSGLSAAVSLGAGAILIPQLGVSGAFWTYCLASAARALPAIGLLFRDEKVGSGE